MSTEERPEWVRGELRIARAALDDIEAHALQEFPSECCGWLTGPADDPRSIDRSVREENQADKLHKMDPKTFPRTSETYFALHALRFERARQEGEASGQPVKVIYHSHCQAGAYFSAEDAATFTALGELSFPVAFVVVSVIDAVVVDRKLWNWESADRFVEAKLVIE